jgi:hypothetical protein
MRWRHQLDLALIGVLGLGLTACGGVKENPGVDGSTGSETDAGEEPDPGSDSSPDDDDAGTVSDAAPPGECEDGVTPLLANASFEEAELPNGALGWVEDPPPATYPDDQIPVEVPDGNRAALIGSAAEAEVRLTQEVQVPDATESLRLSGVACIETDETEEEEFDTVEVVLLDESGNVVEQLGFANNLAEEGCPPGWMPVRVDDIPAHAGETLQFQFHGSFDQGNQTSFYFDAVALDALGPCPE